MGYPKTSTISETTKNNRQTNAKSIAVFGAGPGLGQAVARRYVREGYTVVPVARRQEQLEPLAKDFASALPRAYQWTAKYFAPQKQ